MAKLLIHRKEQDDLRVIPWVCVHLEEPGRSTRVLCVSEKGVETDPLLQGYIATGSVSDVEVDPTMHEPETTIHGDAA